MAERTAPSSQARDTVPAWYLAAIRWMPHVNVGVLLALMAFVVEHPISGGLP